MAITFSSTLSLRGASAILVLFVCCQNPNTGDALKLNKTMLKKKTKDSRYYNDGRTLPLETLEELSGAENPSEWLQFFLDEWLQFFLDDLGMLKPTVSTPAFIGDSPAPVDDSGAVGSSVPSHSQNANPPMIGNDPADYLAWVGNADNNGNDVIIISADTGAADGKLLSFTYKATTENRNNIPLDAKIIADNYRGSGEYVFEFSNEEAATS